MAPEPPFDQAAKDATLAALDRDGRPGFAVDGEGRVVSANGAARRLLSEDGLDAAAARTLARLAVSGASTMVRLRLGAAGRLAPLAFRTRPIDASGDLRLLALEGLARTERPAPPEVAISSRGIAPDAERGDRPPEPEPALPPEADEPVGAEEAGAQDVRFVFEIDGERRLSFLSPDLAAAVGGSARDALGRSWSDLDAELGLDPDGAVARALGGTGGWSDLPVSWPMPNGRRLPLALSALPMFDRGRTLVGFRGLGRSAGLATRSASAGALEPSVAPPPAAERAADAPARDDRNAEPAVVSAEDAVRDGPVDAVSADEAEAEEAQADRPAEDAATAFEEDVAAAAPRAARSFGRNVVPLRETAPPVASLSTSEESAFDEIARRLRGLGVRTSSTPVEEDAPSRPEPWMLNDAETRVAVAARPEELLRLLDRLPVGALALKGGEVAYANRAALEMLGHADLRSLAERDAGTLFDEPLPRDGRGPATVRLLARDGDEVEAEARLSAIVWEGEPATLVSLKRVEGAVAAAREAIERERETAAILDTATDGVLTLDGAGRILSVNRSAEALFGFEARDVVGSLFTLSLAPESRKSAFDYLDRIRQNGVAAVMNDGREVLGLARQGGAIPLYMTIGRIGQHDNDRFCAVLRDVTPWKKAEEELLAAKRQAERASAQKSAFLTKVSHEIRTPLNAIIGFAEVMMEERFGPVGSPRYKDYLRDIHVSGGHLVGLVNDLVDIARVEAGGAELEPSPIDLNEVAQQAVALLQPQAARDRVIIRASLARGLPPVMADRRSVRQIVAALAANAVKLSRPGGQVIVATAITDVGQAVIRVRDAGAGMTKQELAYALEPFRPLGVDEGGADTGLGLPLAKALAEANGAALALSSEPGQGTLAEVIFPATQVLAG